MKKLFLLVLITICLAACSDDKHTFYNIENNEVIYHYVERLGQNYYSATYHTKKVKEADVNSFESLNKEYGKDKSSVFFEGNKIARDPSTFKIIDYRITRDKNGAYCKDYKIEYSDGLSFKILSSYYAKDKHNIYYYTNTCYTKLESTTVANFELINNAYARDASYVYYKGDVLVNANPKKIKLLSYSYSIDETNVYYENTSVNEGEANSFSVLSYGYAKDNAHLFFEGKLLSVDYNSFIVYDKPVKSPKGIYYYAEDDNYYYYQLTAVKKENSNTKQ